MADSKSLTDRLSFMNMDGQVLARLRGLKTVLMKAMPEALEAFYGKISGNRDLSALFKSAQMMEAAKTRQRMHWDRITDGTFDAHYLEAVTKVGNVHARIGLEPRWYIGGYALIIEHLIPALLAARWPKRSWFGRQAGPEETAEELIAVTKATFLDMDLAISVYLEASETARLETEARAKAATEAVIKGLSDAISNLANGNLTYRIGEGMPAEYAGLRSDFNGALERLAATLSNIQTVTRVINTGVDEIAQASDDLSRRTEQQAASLVETTAALSELTEAVKRTATGAAKVNEVVGKASTAATNSRGVVNEAGAAMGQIETSSQEIGQIIGLIDDIAFQTNLLALNAGVEAARAGDAGRGFAVVASEVRALAQRSAEAAKAIKGLISTSSAQVTQGVDLVRRTGEALESIVASVTQVEGLIADIATSAHRQASGLNQVSEAVNQVNNVVQQNAAMVEQTTAAAHSLKSETGELGRAVAAFQIAQGATRPTTPRKPALVQA
jgi:methyl-accepting chemotaxis protein